MKKCNLKFIRIWEFKNKLENEIELPRNSIELYVGPDNFIPIMKLGEGSFG